MAARPTPCKLCRTRLPKSHLDEHGHCVACTDQLQVVAKSSLKEAVEAELQQLEQWEIIAQSVEKAAKVRQAEEAHQAEIDIIKQELEKRDERERELASRALARRSLLHFVERKVSNYKAGWLHEDMARRIEKFIAAIERGESPRLILSVSPRSGKSELASESGPLWALGHHPDWNIMLTSYSDELPVAWSRNIREYIKSDEYRTLFPNGPEVSKIDAGAKAWATEQGGGVRAAGAGGSILGFGANYIVIDDPIKGAEEADSPALLDKIFDWATSTLYSRLAPGGGILIIQQRWSSQDLVGRFTAKMQAEMKEVEDLRRSAEELRSNPSATEQDLEDAERYEAEAAELAESMDRWDVIEYQALAEDDEYLTPDGDIVKVTEHMAPEPEWRMLRRKGEAIDPQRYSRSYYLKLKRLNPRRFAALYQQKPLVDAGAYFALEDFANRYTQQDLPDKKFLNKYAAWDLAIGTAQTNDYTVGVVIGIDHENTMWVLDRIRGRFNDLDKVADMVIDLHTKWECTTTGVEHTHLSMALMPILKRKMEARSTFINLASGKDALKPISDKAVRARQLQATAKAGRVRIPAGETWDQLVEELVNFRSSKIDDSVDALAWATILSSRDALPDDPHVERSESSWLDEFLKGYVSSELTTDKTFMTS